MFLSYCFFPPPLTFRSCLLINQTCLFCPKAQPKHPERNKFIHAQSCRNETTAVNSDVRTIRKTLISSWTKSRGLLRFYSLNAGLVGLTGDGLCPLRGQESAGIVTCDGADPPTYTAHKVIVTSCSLRITHRHIFIKNLKSHMCLSSSSSFLHLAYYCLFFIQAACVLFVLFREWD